jgi:hypothetical protein
MNGVMLATICLLAALGGAACNDNAEPSHGEVTGVIVEVQGEGLGQVETFTVRSEGETFEFVIDEAADYGFPLDHLNEHRVTGEPVVVVYEEREGSLVALEIEDA